jgi:glycosyltransferase involved in cell wall biosynthesis
MPNMPPLKVSILVPVYNEEEFVETLLQRVLDAPIEGGIEREIVVVDDGSTDGSVEAIEAMAARHGDLIKFIRHERNRGKGAALRTAIEHASGEFAIIQDADLEYDPREYGKLLGPLVRGDADAVYGSRFMASGERRVLYFWHSVANRLLTGLCNLVADLNLSDMETCYKALRMPLLKSIPIRNDRFGIEPELTIKLARREARIYETPISYHGRTYSEGKKIGLKDALEAAYVIVRCAFTRNIYKASGPETLEAFSSAARFNRWMADTILPYLGREVAEIGAGIGNLTQMLIARRSRYVAMDIDHEHLARLKARFHHRPRLEVRACDLGDANDFTALAGQMDSVVCLNVLEHVEDDRQGLENIHRILKPGGQAVVLVPHDQRLYGALDKALGHRRRYSRDELANRMEEAGFKVVRVLEFNRISWPGWYVNGRLLGRAAISPTMLAAFDRFVWLWRRIDHLLPWPPTSIIAIGAKADGGSVPSSG